MRHVVPGNDYNIFLDLELSNGIALPGFITLMSLQEQQNQSRSILISFF